MPARTPALPRTARRALMQPLLCAALAAAWAGVSAEEIVINPGLVQTLPPNTRIIKPAAAPASAPTTAAAASAAPAPVRAAVAPPPQDGALASLGSELGGRIQQLAHDSAVLGSGNKNTRVEIEVGALDPRLRLAPCQKIEPYLPPGLPTWGRTRIGLKCVQGSKAWNVSLPLTVHVWRPALVLRDALPAGTVLLASHLMEAEVDLAAGTGMPVAEANGLVGRSLQRGMAAGSALRQPDLKARQWFAAGETVKVVAGGAGWAIATEAQAMNPGIEGQTIRVRTEAGKVLMGRAVADRLVEVAL
ncbi:MAG TPA: flagellar basal body P-ring formation chaperone FlgA [Ideonella sp.]|uniref:flagellar basal body P-ring formation chaperone FlgA n=1 Tax=Ideonella sp. TaxID=1929293 RepID=UPI002C14E169|nr:flagellar basal body P-ring formation chaperone FlgA [Ideonella sp.]HSI50002.1 flagellar basal body P-ring formation chaperone FlgA [Ideonella sp.]